MVPRLIRFAVAIALLCVSAAALALDLTPRPGIRELEAGMRLPVVRFDDGTRTLTYEPPPGWKVSGTGKILNFRPDSPLWSAHWKLVDEPSVRGLDSAAVETMKALALADIPSDATAPEVVADQRNTLILEGLESHEIVVAYLRFGRRYRRSTLFLDLSPKQQLQVRVTAPADEFDKAHEAMRASFYSIVWQ